MQSMKLNAFTKDEAGHLPLWHQFAAQAYAWDPAKRDTFRTSAAQAAAAYPARETPDLWQWARNIAIELDARADGQPPRISLDMGTFADPVFQASVRAQLKQDGARIVAPMRTVPGAKPSPSTKVPWPLVLGVLWLLTRKSRRGRRF